MARALRERFFARHEVRTVGPATWRAHLDARLRGDECAAPAATTDPEYERALAQWSLLAAHGGVWLTDATLVLAPLDSVDALLAAAAAAAHGRPSGCRDTTTDLLLGGDCRVPRLVLAGTSLRAVPGGFHRVVDDRCAVCEPGNPAAREMARWLRAEYDGGRSVRTASFRRERVGERLSRLRPAPGFGIVQLDGRLCGQVDACGRDVDPRDARVAFARRPFRCGVHAAARWVDLEGLGTRAPDQAWALDVSPRELVQGDYWLSDAVRRGLAGAPA